MDCPPWLATSMPTRTGSVKVQARAQLIGCHATWLLGWACPTQRPNLAISAWAENPNCPQYIIHTDITFSCSVCNIRCLMQDTLNMTPCCSRLLTQSPKRGACLPIKGLQQLVAKLPGLRTKDNSHCVSFLFRRSPRSDKALPQPLSSEESVCGTKVWLGLGEPPPRL